MKFNFADIEERDNAPLEPGTYNVTITSGELREAKDASKSDGINWEFTVDEGQPNANRKTWDTTYLSEKSLWRLKSLLSACGMDVDGELDFEIEDLEGKKLSIEVTQREYNGKMYANVKTFRAAKNSGSILPG